MRARWVRLLVMTVACGCGGGPTENATPPDGHDLVIIQPAQGAGILGSWVSVDLETPGFRFVPPGGARPLPNRRPAPTSPVPQHGEVLEGHALVWFDRDPAGEPSQTSTVEDFTVRDVPRGAHQLVIELVDSDGASFDPPLKRTASFSTSNLLERIERDVFATSCALSSCHAGSAPRANLDLSAGTSHSQLFMREPENPAALAQGMMRVVPFDPDASFLWMKINDPASEYGQRMPDRGAALPAESKSWIRRWIEQGALPNDF